MTTWNTTNKSSTTFSATAKSDPGVSQYQLNVGSGYKLLIATGLYLIIQPGINGTIWDYTAKS